MTIPKRMTIWTALLVSGVAAIWIGMVSAVAYRVTRVSVEHAGERT